MLTKRGKNLIKSAYLAEFEKAWYIALDTDSSDENFFIDSEVFESCENWLNEPVDLAGMFTIPLKNTK